ncbi:MAG: hypothetical protein WCG52_04970 [bacterium]|jgi:hypothetical protein
MNLQPWMIPEHLAPGDAKSLEGDWAGMELHRITSAEDPFFEMAFGALCAEFGDAGEMEQASVIARRLQWLPEQLINGASMQYALQLVTHAGEFVAVRDHTVIILESEPRAVVHLSHNLVAPEWRRSGIAGWMRALPVATAMDSLQSLRLPITSPITLIGEMEHFDPTRSATLVRLTAYEKAGFKMVDPSRVSYLQPDFRDPSEIDLSSGPQPLPLTLMLRRIGREAEDFVGGAEILHGVKALYKMYASEFRAADMHQVYESLKAYPASRDRIPLKPPTS